MTKKHFEAIAAIVASERRFAMSTTHAVATVDRTAYKLSDYFATENPQFDRVRFLRACGVEVQS